MRIAQISSEILVRQMYRTFSTCARPVAVPSPGYVGFEVPELQPNGKVVFEERILKQAPGPIIPFEHVDANTRVVTVALSPTGAYSERSRGKNGKSASLISVGLPSQARVRRRARLLRGIGAGPPSPKFGFIDQGGSVVINPQFDDADSFDGGVARVVIGGALIAAKPDWVYRQIRQIRSNPTGF